MTMRRRVAYTDQDNRRGLTTAKTILSEYRKLKLPPVMVGHLLLSPELVEALQADEPAEHPEMGTR